MTPNMDEIKGRAQQAAGDITDNDEMRAEGEKQEHAGKIKGLMDKGKDKINDLVDDAKNKVDEHKK